MEVRAQGAWHTASGRQRPLYRLPGKLSPAPWPGASSSNSCICSSAPLGLFQLCHAAQPLDLVSGVTPCNFSQYSLASRKACSDTGFISTVLSLCLLKRLKGRNYVSPLESCKLSLFSRTTLTSLRTDLHIVGVLWERKLPRAKPHHSPYASSASWCYGFLWKVKLLSLENLSGRKLTRLWFNSMSHSWNRRSTGIWPNKLSFVWSRVSLS